MNDVMLDLETLGTRAGCATLSIGSVGFSTEGLGEEFYCEVNQASCAAYGLFTEQSTLAWWNRQSPEARKVLEATRDEGGLLLPDALSQFTNFLSKFNLDQVRVWGNGSDFDQPILAAAYAAVDLPLPWKFWNNRCYRTLAAVRRGVPKPPRQGTYHNALDDAKTQAMHAMLLLR